MSYIKRLVTIVLILLKNILSTNKTLQKFLILLVQAKYNYNGQLKKSILDFILKTDKKPKIELLKI